jgi:hypothetical protein
MLFLCGTVSAQPALVEHKDKDDPCALFKMRILVPGNQVDFRLRDQKLKDGIDYKMAWNPCPQPEPQFAFALVQPAPERLGNLLVPRSFGFQFLTVKSEKKKQAGFQFPQHLSPFGEYLRQ